MKSASIIFFAFINTICVFAQWVILNPYPQQNNLNSVVFTDINNGWTAGDEGTILHTSNSGVSWTTQNSTSTETLYSIDFINSNTGWCSGSLGQMLKTINGGNDWNLVDTLPLSDFVYGIDFIEQNMGWAAEFYGRICHTTNGGENWVIQFYDQTYWLWSISFPDQSNGWAVGLNTATQEGIIVNTIDGGVNWSPQYNLYQRPFYFVQFIDADNGWVVGSYGTILHTTDGGTNWLTQTSGSANNLYSVNFVDSNIGWSCGMNGKILNTTDGGNLWQEQISGSNEFIFSIFFTDQNNGWAVGQNGIMLHTTNGGITDVGNEEVIPNSFDLKQNYPNPFNPSTRIKYQLPSITQVTLKVYDILGNEVATLVNEEKPAGSYEVEFSPSSLPSRPAGIKHHPSSGVYFCRLQTENYSKTIKMLYLK